MKINAFTSEGLKLLFNWLEKVQEENTEFDPQDIRGSYSEVALKNVAKDANLTHEEFEEIEIYEDGEVGDELVVYDWETMNDEQLKAVVEEYLGRKTCIIGFTDEDTVVYQDF